jgi:hypothetical protein
MEKAKEKGKDPKEAREKAKANWKHLDEDERQYYEDEKDKIIDLYEELRDSQKSITAFSIFYKDELENAKEKNYTTNLKEVGEKWQNANQKIKDRYADIANQMKETAEKNRNLYEIAFNLKPRKPLGAYNLFMIDMAKNNKLDSKDLFKSCAKLWKSLPEQEKERYLKIAKKEQLAYIVKKMEFNAYLKKNHKVTAPTALNLFVSDLSKEAKNLNGEHIFMYGYKRWKKADAETVNKYEKLAAKAKEAANKKNEDFKSMVFSVPKRPGNAYICFFKEQMTEHLKANPGKTAADFSALIAEAWAKLPESKKEKYKEQSQRGLEEYNCRMEFFKENGYYDSRDQCTPYSSNKRSQTKEKENKEKNSKEMNKEDNNLRESKKKRSESAGKRSHSSKGKEENNSKKGKSSKRD